MGKQIPYERLESHDIAKIEGSKQVTKQVGWAALVIVVILFSAVAGCGITYYTGYLKARDVQQHLDVTQTKHVQVDSNPTNR